MKRVYYCEMSKLIMNQNGDGLFFLGRPKKEKMGSYLETEAVFGFEC